MKIFSFLRVLRLGGALFFLLLCLTLSQAWAEGVKHSVKHPVKHPKVACFDLGEKLVELEYSLAAEQIELREKNEKMVVIMNDDDPLTSVVLEDIIQVSDRLLEIKGGLEAMSRLKQSLSPFCQDPLAF